MKRGILAIAALLLLAFACGGATKGPPGKSVVVKESTGEFVKNGVYEATLSIGSNLREVDGGLLFVTVSSILSAPDNTTNAISINIADVTTGKQQALKVGQLGWGVDPSNVNTRKLWGNTSGSLTVSAYDAGSIVFSVVGAKMIPLPLPDGGARGTFTLDVDLNVTGLNEY